MHMSCSFSDTNTCLFRPKKLINKLPIKKWCKNATLHKFWSDDADLIIAWSLKIYYY